MDGHVQPEPRWGWLALSGLGALLGLVALVGGLWALNETVRTGFGSPLWVLTGTAGGTLFWAMISAGAWRRAREPEPEFDPADPAPVATRFAFMAANVVLAALISGFVAIGFWAGVTSARDAERTEKVRARVEVAARRADLTVADVEKLAASWHLWFSDPAADPEGDPMVEALAVDGAEVIDVAVGEGRASILFRPDAGPPCVALDVDENDIISTRRTDSCN